MRKILFVLLLVLIPMVGIADIAPMPDEATQVFKMANEIVKIEILKDRVEVLAEFDLVMAKKPIALQYCFYNPTDQKRECGKEYYQFNYIYPLLPGQKFSSFKVYVDGAEVQPRDNDYVVYDAIPEVKNWFEWHSPRYEIGKIKFPLKAKIRVVYSEPIKFAKGRAEITYVLRTGALWMGEKIFEGRIELKSEYKNLKFSIPPSASEKSVTSWDFKDYKPDKDLVISIKK